MKILIPKNKVQDPVQFIRRCGYGLIFDRRRGVQSFVHRLSRELYPRFHVYVDDRGDHWSLNLHLDQRQTMYEGVNAHSGEYDGEVVEREGERIKNYLQ